MEQDIQERLHIYEREGLASHQVVQFVHDMLSWLEQSTHYTCNEETTGPLASHLMLALERVQRGEDLGSAWDLEVHNQARQLSALLPLATYIQQQALQQLHISLPSEEIDFVLLHLGAFLARNNDPRVAHLEA
ncbi:PRD domain-containing protein [Ktedonosporobacter rubrisoli]|uniref:PRD domain-containing protein n=1 Tax=Ktedonosporobacter rubrisoli TaxID=2509675 RepID=A0A4P6K446_KTERU|nr:PRD domain-containing protein [Ktedonosporobacter rubrisoli]QBD82590.1 PRD domain-containing protein [Ktedonosporobacter rubrisoli]